MSSTPRKMIHLNTVSVNLGCSCRKPWLSSIFNPKPKSSKITPKYQKYHNVSYSSSTTSSSAWEENTRNSASPSTFSSYVDQPTTSASASASASASSSSSADGLGRVGPKTVAVEKESSDPYLDFRQSMLQMIVENEIYSKDDLKELLNCFLQLNSPSLHGVIIRVFTEIWNNFFFSSKPKYSSPRLRGRPKYYEI